MLWVLVGRGAGAKRGDVVLEGWDLYKSCCVPPEVDMMSI